MDYRNHYIKSKKKYCNDHGIIYKDSTHPSDIIAVSVNEEKNIIQIDETYHELVEKISSSVKNIYDSGVDCEYSPSKDSPIAIKYRFSNTIPGVNEMADFIIPQLEKNVFMCNLMCDRLLTMRSVVTTEKPVSSWLWHYDNQPKEIVKIMIYLNNIGENNAPFEYLHGPGDFIEIINPTKNGPNDWKPDSKWPNTRVPEHEINKRISNGAIRRKVTGPKGTMILFDNNSIHRANICKENYRDVIIFRIRPTVNVKKPYIHDKWTKAYWSGGAPKDPRYIGGDKESVLHE